MSDVPTGTILAVDDTKYNLDLLVGTLGDQHDLSVAMNSTTERREGCWGIDNAMGNKPGEDPPRQPLPFPVYFTVVSYYINLSIFVPFSPAIPLANDVTSKQPGTGHERYSIE